RADFRDDTLQLCRRRGIYLLAVLLEQLLGRVCKTVQLVLGLYLLATLLVGSRVGFGLPHHSVYLVFRETRTGSDSDLLLAACPEILGRDVHYTVGVYVEGHLYLRHASRRGRYAYQMELTKCTVVARHRPFALQNVDFYRGLIVRSGREDLALAR